MLKLNINFIIASCINHLFKQHTSRNFVAASINKPSQNLTYFYKWLLNPLVFFVVAVWYFNGVLNNFYNIFDVLIPNRHAYISKRQTEVQIVHSQLVVDINSYLINAGYKYKITKDSNLNLCFSQSGLRNITNILF